MGVLSVASVLICTVGAEGPALQTAPKPRRAPVIVKFSADDFWLNRTGGIWERGANPSLRPSLETAWLPYLNGHGTRDEALAALMKLAGK